MKLEGIHHITRDHRRRRRQRRVLRRRARAADGQADRQPGRPDRLPPVLRRRRRLAGDGPDVLRVSGRGARARRARGWSTGSSGASARAASLEFWAGAPGRARRRDRAGADGSLLFADPEGLAHELVRRRRAAIEPLRASAPEIPPSTRCRASTACARTAPTRRAARGLLLRDARLHDRGRASSWEVRGERARQLLRLRRSAAGDGRQPGRRDGAPRRVRRAAEDEEAWRARVAEAGAHPTPVIDRFYFRSVYFREPSGVLFEIATIGPGFAVDEDARASRRAAVAAAALRAAARAPARASLTPLPYPRPPDA